jgi:phosphoribosyl 1,2-cyclic phosphodiesterase
MRFAYLGSGSRGNAAIVESGDTRILLDCGFTLRETEARLARLGLDADALSGVLLTHEHSDHMSGIGPLARRYGLPVWMTRGTGRAIANRAGTLPDVRHFDPHENFEIGDLQLHPFPVPHDALEPAQFVFSDGDVRLGVLTDIGRPTAHVESMLSGCDALALECNHDRAMLARGPYPQSLKTRIGGGEGHLDNDSAAELLGRIDSTRLQHLIAVHLSETNNLPTLAQAALAGALGCGADFVQVADQEAGLSWQGIS